MEIQDVSHEPSSHRDTSPKIEDGIVPNLVEDSDSPGEDSSQTSYDRLAILPKDPVSGDQIDSKLPCSSYHSVPYEPFAYQQNEDGNIAHVIPIEKFQESFRSIPYESADGATSRDDDRIDDRLPSSAPSFSEGSLQEIPYQHEASSRSFHSESETREETAILSLPDAPDDEDESTFPGVPSEVSPDARAQGLFFFMSYEPYESESDFRVAFPSLPSDSFPGIPQESESSLREELAESEPSLHQEQPRDNSNPTPKQELSSKARPSKRVQDIFSEIDKIDIDKIQLRPDTTKYLETLNGYLQCFERLQVVYAEADQDGILADHKIQNISKSMPAQVSQYGKQIRNIVELYDAAALVLPVFISKVRGLVASVQRELKSEDIHFVLPPGENKLKGRRRAQEKATKYISIKYPGAPESWLYDIVRGSVVFSDASQLLYFLGRLQADRSIKIVKSKNRFRSPALSGYRDWMLQIQFSAVVHPRNSHRQENCDCWNVPHICELQLHHKAIKEADAQLGSHRYYEFLREYYDGSTGSLEERLEDLRMISDGHNSLNLNFLKQVIQNPVGIERMDRLASLFADHVNDYRLAMVIANATRSIEMKNVYTKLGKILQQQGRLNDAMEMYLRDLDIRLETLGKDHEDIQWAYSNIATVLSEQGRYGEALNMYQESLKIQLQVLGHDHADTAKTYNGMALVLGRKGKYDESMAMHREALDIQLKVLGQGHPDIAASYFGLASVMQKKNCKSKTALTTYDCALKIRLKSLGRDHPEVATVYFNIGNILLEQNRYKEAKNTFQQVIDIRIKTLGRYHSLTAQAYHALSKTHYNMAMVFSRQGRLDGALKLFQQALDIQIKIRGPSHPATGRIYKTMARILEQQFKRDEAKKMLKLARKCQKDTAPLVEHNA